MIDCGQAVATDSPENLKASIGQDRVQITTADDVNCDQGNSSKRKLFTAPPTSLPPIRSARQ
jgi:hypothetical protein